MTTKTEVKTKSYEAFLAEDQKVPWADNAHMLRQPYRYMRIPGTLSRTPTTKRGKRRAAKCGKTS